MAALSSAAVAINNLLGVLLRVVQILRTAQLPETSAERAGVAGRGGLANVQTDERLLQFEIVQLHARVFVESGVALAQTVGGLERAPRLLRIALFQRIVAKGEHLLGFLRFPTLQCGLALQVALQIERRGHRRDLLFLQLQRARPVFHLPFLVQVNPPGDVFQRQIKLRREQFEIKRPRSGLTHLAAVKNLHRHGLVRCATAAPSGIRIASPSRHGQTPFWFTNANQ